MCKEVFSSCQEMINEGLRCSPSGCEQTVALVVHILTDIMFDLVFESSVIMSAEYLLWLTSQSTCSCRYLFLC